MLLQPTLTTSREWLAWSRQLRSKSVIAPLASLELCVNTMTTESATLTSQSPPFTKDAERARLTATIMCTLSKAMTPATLLTLTQRIATISNSSSTAEISTTSPSSKKMATARASSMNTQTSPRSLILKSWARSSSTTRLLMKTPALSCQRTPTRRYLLTSEISYTSVTRRNLKWTSPIHKWLLD